MNYNYELLFFIKNKQKFQSDLLNDIENLIGRDNFEIEEKEWKSNNIGIGNYFLMSFNAENEKLPKLEKLLQSIKMREIINRYKINKKNVK